MKTCPYCAESIQDAAIKCRHCGSMLAKPPAGPIRKRLGVFGSIVLGFGCLAGMSTVGLLSEDLLGPALLDALLTAGLFWGAWNTGAIFVDCPSCKTRIPTELRAGRVQCNACGHAIEMRPTA